jgi:phage shock protein E
MSTIIDVRSPMEFMGGHVAGSINIPLMEIPERFDEFSTFAQPIVLCCASGARSAQAVQYLQSNGITCEDGGCWTGVNYKENQKTECQL